MEFVLYAEKIQNYTAILAELCLSMNVVVVMMTMNNFLLNSSQMLQRYRRISWASGANDCRE